MGAPVASGTLPGSTSGSCDSGSRVTRSSARSTYVRMLHGIGNIGSPWVGSVCACKTPRIRPPASTSATPATSAKQARAPIKPDAARSTTLRCPSLARTRAAEFGSETSREMNAGPWTALRRWVRVPALEAKQGVRAGCDDDVPADGVGRPAGGEEQVDNRPVCGALLSRRHRQRSDQLSRPDRPRAAAQPRVPPRRRCRSRGNGAAIGSWSSSRRERIMRNGRSHVELDLGTCVASEARVAVVLSAR